MDCLNGLTLATGNWLVSAELQLRGIMRILEISQLQFKVRDSEFDAAAKMELFERRRRLWRHFPLFVTDAHKFWRVQSDPRSTRVLIEFWGKMRRWWGGLTIFLYRADRVDVAPEMERN